ncbi:DUF2946 family protein [Rhizobium sp. TRM95796]|uniref:DUF2946 family protein n=1 Tax=Rhizobium sp. TRM95796 TaxID=2979862 RepID=UPI0021E83291|nr:DUF2946 family protein [Rhizobium sp. TRM95796]MCV3764267.1 hypothetical protein [Rhizobium sp. TRM95796]
MPGFLRAKGAILRILCAVAFVLLGFSSHSIADADGAIGARYQLPDGSYASLCEPGGGDRQSTPADHCKTCLIAQPHTAPAPGLTAFQPPVFNLLGLAAPATFRIFTPKPTFRRQASRGPPMAA